MTLKVKGYSPRVSFTEGKKIIILLYFLSYGLLSHKHFKAIAIPFQYAEQWLCKGHMFSYLHCILYD